MERRKSRNISRLRQYLHIKTAYGKPLRPVARTWIAQLFQDGLFPWMTALRPLLREKALTLKRIKGLTYSRIGASMCVRVYLVLLCEILFKFAYV